MHHVPTVDQRELERLPPDQNEFTLNRFDSSLYVSSNRFEWSQIKPNRIPGYERCRTFGLSKRSEIAEFSERGFNFLVMGRFEDGLVSVRGL